MLGLISRERWHELSCTSLCEQAVRMEEERAEKHFLGKIESISPPAGTRTLVLLFRGRENPKRERVRKIFFFR